MTETKNSTPVQPNISNVPKKDPSGKPIPNTSDGTLVRIRLFDDRERVLFFKDNTSPTARQVCEMVQQKLDLSSESLSAFSLWIVGKDLELQIRPKMEILDMVAKWPRYLEKYTHNSTEISNIAASYKFVFKREAMMKKADEKLIDDEIAVKLLFGEARNNLLSGRYPVTSTDELVKLSGYVLQITYGDFNAGKHGPGSGFLKLCEAWAGNGGKKGGTPYKEYLEIMQKHPFYGSTFFPACKNIPPDGYFELRTDHLLIAVNTDYICVIDEDRHKMMWNGSFEVVEWECTPDSITIEYFPPKTADNPAPKKASSVFITPQAHLIDSLSARAIYLIEKAEKLKKIANSKKTSTNHSKTRKSSVAGISVLGDRRKSLQPPSPTVDMPGRISEDPEEAANYLQAVAKVRKGSRA